MGAIRRLLSFLCCAAGLFGFGCPNALGSDLALMSVNSVSMRPGRVIDLAVSGRVSGESTFGLTVLIELVPRPGTTGTVVFTPAPPEDVVQIGDPWPDEGTFTPFDTNAPGLTPTINACVDDNGTFLATTLNFVQPLAIFPIKASGNAEGIWDVVLNASVGDSNWEGLDTTLQNGVIVVDAGPGTPTVSTWGMVVLSLLLLAAGTIVQTRRQSIVV